MERIWIITAGCCAIVAAALLAAARYDAAFVVGALGVVAWFLDVRNRLSREAKLVDNKSDPKGDVTGDPDED